MEHLEIVDKNTQSLAITLMLQVMFYFYSLTLKKL